MVSALRFDFGGISANYESMMEGKEYTRLLLCDKVKVKKERVRLFGRYKADVTLQWERRDHVSTPGPACLESIIISIHFSSHRFFYAHHNSISSS